VQAGSNQTQSGLGGAKHGFDRLDTILFRIPNDVQGGNLLNFSAIVFSRTKKTGGENP